jgi:DNA-binding CsgD family transcriptional regulator
MLRGRGSSIGPMVPFRSLIEALMALEHSDVHIDLAELGPYQPVLARLIPGWGAPAAGDDGASLVVLAEAVLQLAGLAGKGRGCLLILEDMQDFDAETLAVVEYLADNLNRQPVLLLGTIRTTNPSPAMDLARAATQRSSATLLELRRLTRGHLRDLAASCLATQPDQVPGEVIEHLEAGSGGLPLLAEELLSSMHANGLLDRDGGTWRITRSLEGRVPATLTRSMVQRLDRLGQAATDLLSVAAVLGQQFPVAVLQAVSKLDDRELMRHLHADLMTQLVAPDEQTPDWYAFQHLLIRDVLLTLLTPAARRRIAQQAAVAVAAVYPGLPGEWCQVSATLHEQAGDTARAGELLAEAGRRALAQGAAASAVSLLDQARALLTEPKARVGAFASLLYALAEAGLMERAVASAGELDRTAGLLSREEKARLHTRLAWAAEVAGRIRDGQTQVAIARRLLGPNAHPGDSAEIDVIGAHLELNRAGPDRLRKAEALARRSAEAAEQAGRPDVASRAWQLLGAISRGRDPGEGTACLERARTIAVQHGLQIEEIRALIRLGNDDALRDGSLDRLWQVRQMASQAGAVTSRYQAEVSIALYSILRGDFGYAEELIDQVLEDTKRLKLLETTRYALVLQAILAAHCGRRRDMDAALAELREWTGDLPMHTPRVHGLARAWCALLEEKRAKAVEEQTLALAAEDESPTVYHLTGRYGLSLLLRALDGSLDQAEYEATTAVPASQMGWDRQFALFAGAVLAGRAGRHGQAAELAAQAIEAGAQYATGRRVGLRLACEAAIADGWGSPVEWLRDCEEYFHCCGVPAVSGACRALMRQAGAQPGQHRRGRSNIPRPLRERGVTVREHEILQLLSERLSNREIADLLHLSPRTVEKHVASLITKTGQPGRLALGELGAQLGELAKAWPGGRLVRPDT